MIDHVILNVSKLAASRDFYERALASLGYKVILEFPKGVALGRDKPELGIAEGKPVHTGVHLAFTSPDRKTVEAFYWGALDGGGRDNGPPGLRPNYHPDYYGAFVLDPDGNNIEAVCHHPELGL
ncbi:MAG: VOC family protein [Desulfuromonadales bacterium]|jgi:catechol 2,3-dioxygenase-like lactoylglutathione lyase family enzyme